MVEVTVLEIMALRFSSMNDLPTEFHKRILTGSRVDTAIDIKTRRQKGDLMSLPLSFGKENRVKVQFLRQRQHNASQLQR
jgi:hypothetical protein